MKRFRFQQETLLRVKTQLRRQAELRVQESQIRLTNARQQLKSLHAKLHQLTMSVDVLEDRSRRATTAPKAALVGSDLHECGWQLLASSQWLQRQTRELTREIEQIEHEKLQYVRNLKQLDIEVESLQLLRNECLSDFRSGVAKQHNETLDETALRQWQQAADLMREGDSYD